ncbi:unnamed protein product [Mytilus coruscus]|uniref:Uncharacterized protein n=1 Tax=Mytilus coruscus TaxID=42192 RepID=A0A6J8BJI8_MYTCO|nr:unnamed protein product [Mytilus coruscus]
MSKQIIGVFAADQIPFHRSTPFGFIVNTDPQSLPGKHWIACYVDSNNVLEIFDSYGNSSNIRSLFINRYMKDFHRTMINPQRLQSSNSRTIQETPRWNLGLCAKRDKEGENKEKRLMVASIEEKACVVIIELVRCLDNDTGHGIRIKMMVVNVMHEREKVNKTIVMSQAVLVDKGGQSHVSHDSPVPSPSAYSRPEIESDVDQSYMSDRIVYFYQSNGADLDFT